MSEAEHDAMAFPVLKAKVLGVDVVRGFARLCDLARISAADVYDAKLNPQGTQRDLSPKHAQEAYEYVRSEEMGFFPEIFLAVRRPEAVKLKSTSILNAEGGLELCILYVNRHNIENQKQISISRVDGNHRLYYADGKTDGFPPVEKIVSFCMALNVSLDEEIRLFRDINKNQRRMNTSHLDNIKARLSTMDSLRISDVPLYIAKRLASDQDSPLVGLVYDGGKSDVVKFIPLRTLKTGIEYMFSRPTRLSALEDPDFQYKLIRNFFSAVRSWDPDAWKNHREYLMLRGAGLWGICFLGAEVIDRTLARGLFGVGDQLKVLRSGRSWNWHRDGDFKGFSGRGGALKIRDMIVGEFVSDDGKSLKSLLKEISALD